MRDGIELLLAGRRCGYATRPGRLSGRARPCPATDDAFALEVRRDAEQGADGDDAGAADAGDQDAVGLVDDDGRLRQLPGARLRQGRSVEPGASAGEPSADASRRLTHSADRLECLPRANCRPRRSRSSGRTLRRRKSPCCRRTGRSRACGRTRCRPERPTCSSTWRCNRRSPRRPGR